MTIEQIPIKNLSLLENNPRRISKEQMQKLVESLKNDPDFLLKRPVLVNKIDDKLQVYAGNQRIRAAKKLKWKTIACIVDKDVPKNVMKSRIIKDNQTFGEFDFDILANEWNPEDLVEWGFTEDELSFDVKVLEGDEEGEGVLEPKKDEEATTKPGDIYELNEHRIICGDSTMPDTVEKLLDGNEPIIMVTDPPYGVEYDPEWRDLAGKGKRAKGKVQNDDKISWGVTWSLFPGSVTYVWHAGKYCSEVQKSLEDADFEIISQVIWVKQHFALSRGDYHWQHEPCWYAVRKEQPHNWQGSRKESTVWEISNLNCFGKSQDEDDRTAHSTQKPIECMAKPIRNNTAEGDGVYDPFIGSGTTLIACEKLNRICYGIELSPAYCDIIVERWVNYMKKNNLSYEVKKNGRKT